MSSAIFLGNTHFFAFYFSQQTTPRIFSRLREKIQDSFRDLYRNSSISNLDLFMHFIQFMLMNWFDMSESFSC